MTDDHQEPTAIEQEALERIEEARAEAAAYVVQRQPLDRGIGDDIAPAEERIVDALQQARTETDPRHLNELADQAEAARDEVRRGAYGPGSETDADEGADGGRPNAT
ncbi:MAG TPA: hypothetical protein VK992_02360 [Candidatus Caenarcaniphilales bacterium]|nr:hypothetical protein [Candidatus Caenarcaniphilales bacterium]